MSLLVSVRHVGAHPGEHQHGVSIQISISLRKTFLRISRKGNIPLGWILARVFAYVPPFISQILDFIYWTVLIFILIYFEWRDTENQQYPRLNAHYFKILDIWLGSFSFLHYFIFDRITSILMIFCSLGHFVMAIIEIVHLIRVRSWIYCSQPLIKLPTPTSYRPINP